MARACLVSCPAEVLQMIATYLNNLELANMIPTCQNLQGVFTETLYRRDAKFGNSSAMIWAAMLDDGLPEQRSRGCRVMKLSKRHGSNFDAIHQIEGGQATVLHVAAAKNNPIFVSSLLRAGANVNASSTYLWRISKLRIDYREIEKRLGLDENDDRFTYSVWLPMLIPVLNGYKQVVRLLRQAGARNELSYSTAPSVLNPSPTLTLLHVFATSGDESLWPIMHQLQPINANQQISPRQVTPLHLAIEHRNEKAVEFLLNHEADTNIGTHLEQTALSLAIRGFRDVSFEEHTSIATKKASWAVYKRIIELLLEWGADVNAYYVHVDRLAPLYGIIPTNKLELKKCQPLVVGIIQLFVERGARINARSSHGLTVIHHVWRQIIKFKGNAFLEEILSYLIDQGGEVNQPLYPGNSILGELIIGHHGNMKQLGRLLAILIKSGARLDISEVDTVFELWYTGKLRKLEDFRMRAYRLDVSGESLMAAYHRSILDGDTELYEDLYRSYPGPSSPNRLVEASMNQTRRKMRLDYILHLPFDPQYRRPKSGDGWLHIIVDRLEVSETHKEKKVSNEIMAFVKKGTPLYLRDAKGRRAVDIVRLKEGVYEHLRAILHEAADLETEGIPPEDIYQIIRKKFGCFLEETRGKEK